MENIEIKARIENSGLIRERIEKLEYTSVGLDHQIDIYFNTPNGRFKQ